MQLNVMKIFCIVVWVVVPCSLLGVKQHGAASTEFIIIMLSNCGNVKSLSLVLFI
jgi:hypothetical protein